MEEKVYHTVTKEELEEEKRHYREANKKNQIWIEEDTNGFQKEDESIIF